MDTLAHGLWAAAAAKTYNLRCTDRPRPVPAKINTLSAAFWGAFPDLFAFTIPFAWIILGPLFGNHIPQMLSPENGTPLPPESHWVFHLASTLYNYSHSLIVFFIVAGLIWLIKKKVYLAMLGWPLHILLDIPTHSYQFYPTPFLWPVSSWKFDGIAWATPWFMIANYTALALSSLLLWGWHHAKKRAQSSPPQPL